MLHNCILQKPACSLILIALRIGVKLWRLSQMASVQTESQQVVNLEPEMTWDLKMWPCPWIGDTQNPLNPIKLSYFSHGEEWWRQAAMGQLYAVLCLQTKVGCIVVECFWNCVYTWCIAFCSYLVLIILNLNNIWCCDWHDHLWKRKKKKWIHGWIMMDPV